MFSVRFNNQKNLQSQIHKQECYTYFSILLKVIGFIKNAKQNILCKQFMFNFDDFFFEFKS
jgi:hypothetical protein